MKSVKSTKKGKQEHNPYRITASHSLMIKIQAESKTRENELPIERERIIPLRIDGPTHRIDFF
jgi:hypothetical protein